MNEAQFKIAYHYYKKWKLKALDETQEEKRIKAMQKAFFWGEVLTGFAFIKAMEEFAKNNPEARKAITKAKLAMSKKLKDYSLSILKDMGFI